MSKPHHTREEFLAVWPLIEAELLDFVTKETMPGDAIAWLRNNLNYNTPGGKLNRGMSVVDTLQIIKGRPLEKEEYLKAAILGWCVELLQAFFLVADDMMDQSVTRRGQPCWYRVSTVGNIAINDSFMLEGAIYFLLKKHFRSEPYYVHLLELFHDTTFQTELGQLIDLITASEDHVDLTRFSLRRHQLIVIYKTAFYSFYLPVALAMRMANLSSPTDPNFHHGTTTTTITNTETMDDPYKQALNILLPLGEYFQVQDDYLDCFGDPSFIGKIGTDILDNKCSWNVNVALQYCTPEQRTLLDENYGRKDSTCEEKVKEIFSAPNIDITGRYKTYEAEVYKKLNQLIDQVPEREHGLKRDVFRSFLAKIYQRGK